MSIVGHQECWQWVPGLVWDIVMENWITSKRSPPLTVMSPTDNCAHSTFCCKHNYMIIPRNVSPRFGLSRRHHDDMPEPCTASLFWGGERGVLAPWLSRSCEVELIVLTARLCSSSPRWPFLFRFNFGEWEVWGGLLSCFTKPVFFLRALLPFFFCKVLQRNI